jgi:hypothetical protein
MKLAYMRIVKLCGEEDEGRSTEEDMGCCVGLIGKALNLERVKRRTYHFEGV